MPFAKSSPAQPERAEIVWYLMAVRMTLEELAQTQARTEKWMAEIAETQVRTNLQLEEIARSQVRTGKHLEALGGAVGQLAEAQTRTEKRVDELGIAVGRLAEAQTRTEVRVDELGVAVGRLAEAQTRTEVRVDELGVAVERLAEAQTRTEVRVDELGAAVGDLRTTVGALSHNVGFGLEELAAIVLPAMLERDHGLHVDRFTRRFFLTESGEEEVDLYAEARRGETTVPIVGEVKSRIYSNDVRKFSQKLQRVTPSLPSSPVAVMFGFVVHPAANAVAQELGILVVASRPSV